MKNKLKFTVIIILLLSLTCCGRKTELHFGSGNQEGMYYAYAEQLSSLMNEDLTLRIRTTTGSAANIRLLQKGYLDAAIVQNDNLYETAEATEDTLSFSAVGGLYTESIQILVRSDSDIHSLEDLTGKTISVGDQDSGTELNARALLQLHGIPFEDLNVKYLSLSDAADELREGHIDALFYTAGAPTQGLSRLAKETSLRFLSISDEDARRMRNLYPDYVECVIPAGTYQGQTEDIHTLGVRAVLLVSNSLDDETVRKLTQYIFQNAETLRAGIVSEGSYTAAYAAESIRIPFHPGAAAYLKEQGIEVRTTTNPGSAPVIGGQDD